MTRQQVTQPPSNDASTARGPELPLIRQLTVQAGVPRLRSMRDFAESELIVQKGPYSGRPFRVSRQPVLGLLLDAMDSPDWDWVVVTGPQQSGKTIGGYVLPLMYSLFERRETVIGAAPSDDVCADKWREDLEPMIGGTRYARYLPTVGAGSRGGKPRAIAFGNGAVLRWMTAGGGDKARASYTARVVVVTETDGFDESGETSREATKLDQLVGRTRAFTEATGQRARVYLECTLSTSQGRTHREITAGSNSQIVCPCPACAEWILPERAQLVGWRDTDSELEAAEKAHFVCPACGHAITEDERRDSVAAGVLIHKGQRMTGPNPGDIDGGPPQTRRLGFRYTAYHNLFRSASDLGAEEWIAAHESDEDNAQKRMHQFVWAIPYDPPQTDVTRLEWLDVVRRAIPMGRGMIPAGTQYLSIAADLGLRLIYWAILAYSHRGSPHVVDYGVVEVHSDKLAEERALALALREFRDMVRKGWPVDGSADRLVPDVAIVDSGWLTEVVYEFCRDSADDEAAWYPFKGLGGKQLAARYHRPKRTGDVTPYIGDGYHLSRISAARILLVEGDADQWKTWVHARLRTPPAEPGAMTLFSVEQERDHLSFAKHLTAEKRVQEYIASRNEVVERWFNTAKHRANHWFDAAYMAGIAGHMAGARLAEDVAQVAEPVEPRRRMRGISMPDGRAFLPTGR